MTMAAGAQAADLGAEPTRAQVQAELGQAKAIAEETSSELQSRAAITQGGALSAAGSGSTGGAGGCGRSALKGGSTGAAGSGGGANWR
ncbi:hypothetical protein QJT83_22190 [Bordetella bronchiseptica]|uniref:hypothetical protein n=1 Tax=Bordetella bronchiseptica TaxID=518 RepID=UPI003EDB79D1